VVKKLVDQKLTDQEIKRYNITVSEEEIDNNIEQIKAEKKWTDEDFREALKQESISIEFYREQLKQQALRSKLVNRAVKSNIVITNEDITAYYADNLEKFAGEVKYQLRNIIMRVADGAGVDEKETAKQQMQRLRSRLVDGQSIESVIQAASDSPNNLVSTNLGVLNYKDFAPQLKAALDGLPKGTYTTILETGQGYQIFYIEDILREDARSLEDASAEIEEILYKLLSEKEFVNWIEDLRENSHIKIIL
jgi:peptidyl-prolyl cis-trans isomerase SurA